MIVMQSFALSCVTNAFSNAESSPAQAKRCGNKTVETNHQNATQLFYQLDSQLRV